MLSRNLTTEDQCPDCATPIISTKRDDVRRVYEVAGTGIILRWNAKTQWHEDLDVITYRLHRCRQKGA